MSAQAQHRIGFREFYREVFLQEHRSPPNILLHVLGVFLSAALVPYAILNDQLPLVLLYPIVHAVPGLLGHRLFERNEAVGDIRVTRSDHPLWWFIIANHVLAVDVFLGGLRWIPTLMVLSGLAAGFGALQHGRGERTMLSDFYVELSTALETQSSRLR